VCVCVCGWQLHSMCGMNFMSAAQKLVRLLALRSSQGPIQGTGSAAQTLRVLSSGTSRQCCAYVYGTVSVFNT
jgi:hypothetical protein